MPLSSVPAVAPHTREALARERLAGVELLSEKLGISARSIYRWVHGDPISGVSVALPAHKVGRLYFFNLDEVVEWLKLYSPDGTCRVEDAALAAGDAPVPSAKIRRTRKAAAKTTAASRG